MFLYWRAILPFRDLRGEEVRQDLRRRRVPAAGRRPRWSFWISRRNEAHAFVVLQCGCSKTAGDWLSGCAATTTTNEFRSRQCALDDACYYWEWLTDAARHAVSSYWLFVGDGTAETAADWLLGRVPTNETPAESSGNACASSMERMLTKEEKSTAFPFLGQKGVLRVSKHL